MSSSGTPLLIACNCSAEDPAGIGSVNPVDAGISASGCVTAAAADVGVVVVVVVGGVGVVFIMLSKVGGHFIMLPARYKSTALLITVAALAQDTGFETYNNPALLQRTVASRPLLAKNAETSSAVAMHRDVGWPI